jgi:hypothetical protein
MPWKHEWVEPEVAFVCHQWVSGPTPNERTLHYIDVYHAYKDDNWGERLSYWYTLHDGDPANHPPHISGTDHTVFEFDIRSFPTYDDSLGHRDIMQQAIDKNLCTIEDVMIYIEKAHHVSHDH